MYDSTGQVKLGLVQFQACTIPTQGMGNPRSLDEQDVAILSKNDNAAIIAIEYEYIRCKSISDSSGMDAAMRAMV